MSNRDVDAIVRCVAGYYKVHPWTLRGNSRVRSVVKCRWVLMGALRRCKLSLPEIGRALDLHHTTVLHGLRQLAASPALTADVELVSAQVHYSPVVITHTSGST